MLTNNDILTELNELGPSLIPLQKLNVFEVPDNYFRDLAGSVLNNVISEQQAFLPAEAQNVMDVPAGYFDSLADNIMARIKNLQPVSAADEIRELSPALAATGNDNVFTVPARYFNDLPEIIVNRVKPAKVVRMTTRRSFVQYAAAAVITGILGLSLFTVFNRSNSGTDNTTLASVMEKANNIIVTNSFDKELQAVSDEDIIDYLEDNGQDVKAALVAAATDSKELPAAEEYLFDDNTLNDFLDDLNINEYSN